jgi:hypothetical protein
MEGCVSLEPDALVEEGRRVGSACHSPNPPAATHTHTHTHQPHAMPSTLYYKEIQSKMLQNVLPLRFPTQKEVDDDDARREQEDSSYNWRDDPSLEDRWEPPTLAHVIECRFCEELMDSASIFSDSIFATIVTRLPNGVLEGKIKFCFAYTAEDCGPFRFYHNEPLSTTTSCKSFSIKDVCWACIHAFEATALVELNNALQVQSEHLVHKRDLVKAGAPQAHPIFESPDLMNILVQFINPLAQPARKPKPAFVTQLEEARLQRKRKIQEIESDSRSSKQACL